MKSLHRFFRMHTGETCVIIGNGPSLDKTPLEDLQRSYLTFGSNMIYRKPFYPDYYCIIDEYMLRACLPLPPMDNTTLFLRAEARVLENNPIYPIVAGGFSLDASNFIVMGGTVTFALLQLAFYMDFDTILLVGVDHNYPKSSKNGRRLFIHHGDDPDHFTCVDGEPYFKEGVTFAPPELTGTTEAYSIAKEVFEKTGKRIVNLTPGSQLKVFEKGKIEEWLMLG